MTVIKAFLFDVDGVLTPSADVSAALVSRYFASKSLSIKEDEVVPFMGKGMKALLEESAKYLNTEISLDEALSFFRENYSKELKERKPKEKAREFVLSARSKGIKIAIVSSAPSWRVEENLKYMNLSPGDFDSVLTEESVSRNKPFPDIWLKAMEELGVEGKECLVFEDSFSGIRSGKRAGANVVALTSTIGEEKAVEAGADAILSSFAFFPKYKGREDVRDAFIRLKKENGFKKYGALWVMKKRDSLTPEKEKEARRLAMEAMENAYCPYSHFQVGAAVLSASTGRIYSGCNMENASYGATICAERNAITTAVAAEGRIGLDLIVVASRSSHPAPPCAVCLQVISEFALPETPVILINDEGVEERYLFSDLLPHPFEFED